MNFDSLYYLIFQQLNVLERIHGTQTKLKMVHFGWLTYSPAFYDSLKRYLNVDTAYAIFPKSINHPGVYLVIPYKSPTAFVYTEDGLNYQSANLGILILKYLQDTYSIPIELVGTPLSSSQTESLAAFHLESRNSHLPNQ